MTSRGGRNLIILGVGSLLITAATTITSLTLYRVSGDIYLDRSRPGYLPDEDEVVENTETNTNYTFPDSGALTHDALSEYLDELKKVDDRLDVFPDPYAPSPLSDKSLGISSELNEW